MSAFVRQVSGPLGVLIREALGGIVLDTPDLVCFDLPCLVVPRPGTAEEALDRALRRLGLEPASPLHDDAMSRGLCWPGRAARAALGDLLGSDVWADAAAAAFDDAFGAAAARRGITVADGAAACLAQLRAHGARIAVTTEFSSSTREAVLDVLDWPALVAMLVSEDPMDQTAHLSAVETAVDRADVTRVHAVVVAASCTGVAAGREAGVACVVGIPGGQATARELKEAGATRMSSLPQLAALWAGARLVPA
jgi:beta-phosphoglucomutase-like phosphatase (HAD superfamily)